MYLLSGKISMPNCEPWLDNCTQLVKIAITIKPGAKTSSDVSVTETKNKRGLETSSKLNECIFVILPQGHFKSSGEKLIKWFRGKSSEKEIFEDIKI